MSQQQEVLSARAISHSETITAAAAGSDEIVRHWPVVAVIAIHHRAVEFDRHGWQAALEHLEDRKPYLRGAVSQGAMFACGGDEEPGLQFIAEDGTLIDGFTRHGINRAIGNMADRAGTKPQAILDAIRNPLKIEEGVDNKGRPFKTFTGEDARVVMNPQTGQIVSVNPMSGRGAQK